MKMETNKMSAMAEIKEDERPIEQEGDFLKLNAIDHLEFWVGNAMQLTYFWKTLGFKQNVFSSWKQRDS